jgi:hypothetical protein
MTSAATKLPEQIDLVTLPLNANEPTDRRLLAGLRALLEERGAAHPSPQVYTDAFWVALATLSSRGASETLAARAVRTWSLFLAPYAPPEASIEPIAEGLRFAWSLNQLYLHVDVREAGGYEWFSRNHVTGAYEGTAHDVEPELPAAFFRALVALRDHVEVRR